MMQLSIIIPSHNEERTATTIIERVLGTNFGDIAYEVIFVDDGSTDNTDDLIQKLDAPITKLRHPVVRGKSAAVRTGLSVAKGEYIITQDADLELDPNDIVTLFNHAKSNDLSILYGSRRLMDEQRGNQQKTVFYHGGVFVTKVANTLNNANLTDEPTCYKLIKRSLIDEMYLVEERFAYCPEVTAKALRLGHRITELPIKYVPRTIAEGKKIRLKDGVHAVWVLVKYRVLPPSYWKRLAK